ncbi:putative receptor protein kinase ZmPK1 [Cinnamomum micranthum f. kanehirae]|uniref:Putative receptor protein kinase ZmPK1 n=1 Tax=Cinnamomum micranthum f. kanehirae TaxID=337451 RepID=A0A443P5W8_9MAGN|nr:putative receptor protein kinase ZmPK1 [Cinnamomum micranthum f. kanehirae]
MSDPRDWNQGCRPEFNRSCDPQNVKFIELHHMEFYWFDLITQGKKICFEDCSCEAFQYRFTVTRECYPKIKLYNGGILGDQQLVEVKKLQDVIRGEEEFWAEVSTIGRINHMNLVRTWEIYCLEGTRRLLVSEYVKNGSLDKHLFSDGSNGSNTEQFSNFELKIADFGLAKLSQRGRPGSNFSRIQGTKGYIASEWTLNLPITAEVGVYSYGVVILEIVKGSRFSNWVGEEQEVWMRSFVIAAKEK